MNRTELEELIRNRENSGVEFKRAARGAAPATHSASSAEAFVLPACATAMKRRPYPASGPGPTTVCRPSSRRAQSRAS